MKKGGILNEKLMGALTGLGHYDMFVICDAGFPIPKDAVKIDLGLVKGVPTFMQTLKAVLGEVIVEGIYLHDAVTSYNQQLYNEVYAMMPKQKKELLNWDNFRQKAQSAKFFIKTAEFAPCSNMILVSASGAGPFPDEFNIVIG